MLIYVFPPHYQLVYINFDISSFSVISYDVKFVSSRWEIFPFIAGICISYRKDDDKPCFIDLII